MKENRTNKWLKLILVIAMGNIGNIPIAKAQDGILDIATTEYTQDWNPIKMEIFQLVSQSP